MKRIIVILALSLVALNCKDKPDPTRFSDDALNDTFINFEGVELSFNSILEAHEGKVILIDIWASWCKDCIEGLPKLKALQTAHNDVAYVFLSMDKTQDSWRRSIKKYQIKGAHYFMPLGSNCAFGDFVKIHWVPRYMVIDLERNITLFKAIKADDPKIKELLKTL